ncbi:MAG: hypothetical protein ACRDJE_20005 [Dehalococcoidia bacterium]
MFGRKRRDAWVFLKGRDGRSPVGATVRLVERRVSRQAGLERNAGGAYAWTIFPETPHGAYTVLVTYPSGAEQTGRLVVDASAHSVTLDEPATTPSKERG